MAIYSPIAALRLVDSLAVVISQAYQLARVRLASAASPILRLLVQRDHAMSEVEMLRREVAILRWQRENMPAHRRPDYLPAQRLAILQLRRLRGWSIGNTAERFVLHPNTIRSWIKALEGRGNPRLFTGAALWNTMDQVVRWAVHELRRLCPEPEFGTRTIARHLRRAGIAISRSTVQRIVRESKPTRPSRPSRQPMALAAGVEPYHLLKPEHANHVWHMDLVSIRILWLRFTIAAVLDGFTRKLLALRVYRHTPRTCDMVRLVRDAAHTCGRPRFLITDHGMQFRRRFHAGLVRIKVRHVRGPVRAPFFNGKMERAFRTFRIWWRMVLVTACGRGMQCRLDTYRLWYNQHRPHSAVGDRTPEEAWAGERLPEAMPLLARDMSKSWIDLHRLRCRGDPRLPVIGIAVRRAA